MWFKHGKSRCGLHVLCTVARVALGFAALLTLVALRFAALLLLTLVTLGFAALLLLTLVALRFAALLLLTLVTIGFPFLLVLLLAFLASRSSFLLGVFFGLHGWITDPSIEPFQVIGSIFCDRFFRCDWLLQFQPQWLLLLFVRFALFWCLYLCGKFLWSCLKPGLIPCHLLRLHSWLRRRGAALRRFGGPLIGPFLGNRLLEVAQHFFMLLHVCGLCNSLLLQDLLLFLEGHDLGGRLFALTDELLHRLAELLVRRLGVPLDFIVHDQALCHVLSLFVRVMRWRRHKTRQRVRPHGRNGRLALSQLLGTRCQRQHT